jgi:hypothetical protein
MLASTLVTSACATGSRTDSAAADVVMVRDFFDVEVAPLDARLRPLVAGRSADSDVNMEKSWSSCKVSGMLVLGEKAEGRV